MNTPDKKYIVGTPASLPLSVPFTIKPNSFYGIHVKYWILPLILALAGVAYCMLTFPDVALYFLFPIVALAGFIFWLVRTNQKNSLTLTADAITYVKNGVPQVITMTDLATIEWGLMFAGARLYYVLHVKNKTGDIHWKLSVLNFWNTRQLRTVYTSVPAQYQGAQDIQPF